METRLQKRSRTSCVVICFVILPLMAVVLLLLSASQPIKRKVEKSQRLGEPTQDSSNPSAVAPAPIKSKHLHPVNSFWESLRAHVYSWLEQDEEKP
jgi:hypothetical protein